jgi:hypothetical protein
MRWPMSSAGLQTQNRCRRNHDREAVSMMADTGITDDCPVSSARNGRMPVGSYLLKAMKLFSVVSLHTMTNPRLTDQFRHWV